MLPSPISKRHTINSHKLTTPIKTQLQEPKITSPRSMGILFINNVEPMTFYQMRRSDNFMTKRAVLTIIPSKVSKMRMCSEAGDSRVVWEDSKVYSKISLDSNREVK